MDAACEIGIASAENPGAATNRGARRTAARIPAEPQGVLDVGSNGDTCFRWCRCEAGWGCVDVGSEVSSL